MDHRLFIQITSGNFLPSSFDRAITDEGFRFLDTFAKHSIHCTLYTINCFDWELTTGFGLEVVASFACVGVAQQAIVWHAPNKSALTTC